MTYPIISVIIPTYNYAHYITEAINSVLQQTYPVANIEIVVVDDGSTDDTKTILQPFIDNNIVRYLYQENQGKASATKYAIESSTGKYIFNLDADDYFFPDKIKRSVEIFETYPDIVHVASPATFVNQHNEIKKVEQIPEDMLETPLNGNVLLHRFYDNFMLFGGGSTYSARASVLKQIAVPLDVDMFIDEFLILAILMRGKSFFFRQSLSVWRDHTTNYSNATGVKEKDIAKEMRLVNSSSAILKYIESNYFSDRIKKIYQLLDTTRQISLKESTNKKGLRDILLYGKKVFSIKPDWHLIKKYQVLNRLLPLTIYRFAKKLLHRKK